MVYYVVKSVYLDSWLENLIPIISKELTRKKPQLFYYKKNVKFSFIILSKIICLIENRFFEVEAHL